MRKSLTFDQYLKKRLKDKEFRKEWFKSEARFQITSELIKTRIQKGMSQRKLARRAKTTQAVISRLENMTINPSLNLLEKIASAFGRRLEINFRPL